MAVKFLNKELNWGDKVYLTVDPEQNPWILIGVKLSPGVEIYQITRQGELIEVYPFEITFEVDESLRLGV